VADRGNRLVQLEERRAAVAAECAQHLSGIAELDKRNEDLASQSETVAGRQADLMAQRESLMAEVARLEARVNEALDRQAEKRTSLAEADRTRERFQARFELLSRLREEGEGLHSGVREVLRAAAAGRQVTGLIGTVAQLFHVPADYEVAIEVALGGHLQDLVVESWQAAESAIAFLRQDRLGRATFLPLDTVRPLRRLEVPQDKGIVGIGADLVRADERVSGVLEMLLGRTIVARDLEAARRAFDRLKGAFQIVTLAGDVLRSSGSVTGGEGKERSRGQVLAREREWRELPAHLDAAEGHCRQRQAELEAEQAAEAQIRERVAGLETELQQMSEVLDQIREEQRDLERDADEVARQIAWRRDLTDQLDTEADQIRAADASFKEEMTRLESDRKTAEDEIASLQADLENLSGEVLYQRLSEARTAAAVVRGRVDHRQAALDTAEERRAQIEAQIGVKRERTQQLDQEKESLARQVGGQASREKVIEGWLASLVKKIEPAEAEVDQLDLDREALEREESLLRTRLREAENGYSQALLSLNRQEDRLARLRRQIMDDFGLVEMEFTEGLPEQPPLPLGELVSALPIVPTLPEGLEEETHQIKAQVRRMGPVNPNAPEEHAEALDRYTFLSSQAADLEEAARSLRSVIAELDEVMRREFQVVFARVAERFKANFAQLFGGGSAQLVLTDPDNVSITGVEVMARPPGKRQQTLALLSGGERSLAAVALIFALLEVSPPPFCVLDEVDAMLDEANIRRFRRALEALAEQTQFIVITHNRGTIQAADTVYGVSMGDDSVSQVVSLRLEGDRISTPDGSDLDIAKES
jgi:chromosome segregation protein